MLVLRMCIVHVTARPMRCTIHHDGALACMSDVLGRGM